MWANHLPVALVLNKSSFGSLHNEEEMLGFCCILNIYLVAGIKDLTEITLLLSSGFRISNLYDPLREITLSALKI